MTDEPRSTMTTPRTCFWIDETQDPGEHGYVPSVVTENESGHSPLTGRGTHARPWYWGHTLAEAQAVAAKANAKLGLTEQDVTAIVLSSMTAPQVHP